ncbi:insulinase family protein [Phormidium tenue FACHB-886]|nr:insulinase family protein [Phormidium tenue FACHB-886]
MVALLKADFPNADRCSVNQFRLDNGLTVIHQQVTAAPAVVVDVWVKAGAAAEPSAWSGMAHFLEHMIFKGTDRLLPGQFDQIIENRGGITNAATSHDYAHYYINTASSCLPKALPCLAELLTQAAIPAEEFELEREVVLEEIRQWQDDSDAVGYQALMSSIYQQHPYGQPVLGNPLALKQQSPQEMRCFHRAHYQPEKMSVMVVGDIACDPALELVERSFKFPSAGVCPRPAIVPEPSLTEIRRQELRRPRLGLARLMMGWMGAGVEDLRSAYGLDLLSVLLASGRTSRLVRELREERQLVQEIGSSFSLQRDSSLLTLTAWLEPQHLAAVEAIITDRLAELAVSVSETELERYKRLLCNDFAFSTETCSQIAGLYGYYSTIAQPEQALCYPQIIRSLQTEELRQLAEQYLSPERYAVTVLLPEE